MSTLLAAYALINALYMGQTVLIISPSERQSMHMMSYIQGFYRTIKSKVGGMDPISETKKELIFDEGEIYSLPNSPNTIRGFRAHIIIFDEFAHFLNGTDKTTLEAIMPSISRGGKLILNSTPFGETGEYYDIWSNEKRYSHYKRVLMHWSECPDLDIEPIRASMDEVSFSQEYENQFVGEEDSFFPFSLLKQCVNEELDINTNFDPGVNHVFGVDFGRIKDLTAVVGYEVRHTGHQQAVKRVKIFKLFRNTPFDQQLAYIETLLGHANVTGCQVDSSGMGLPLFESLQGKFRSKVAGITFTNQIKEQMMVNLKVQLERGEIVLPNEPQLLYSLHMIQRKQTQGRHVQFDADRDAKHGHADAAWALAMAVFDQSVTPVYHVA